VKLSFSAAFGFSFFNMMVGWLQIKFQVARGLLLPLYAQGFSTAGSLFNANAPEVSRSHLPNFITSRAIVGRRQCRNAKAFLYARVQNGVVAGKCCINILCNKPFALAAIIVYGLVGSFNLLI
jgi:hypothetical protein